MVTRKGTGRESPKKTAAGSSASSGAGRRTSRTPKPPQAAKSKSRVTPTPPKRVSAGIESSGLAAEAAVAATQAVVPVSPPPPPSGATPLRISAPATAALPMVCPVPTVATTAARSDRAAERAEAETLLPVVGPSEEGAPSTAARLAAKHPVALLLAGAMEPFGGRDGIAADIAVEAGLTDIDLATLQFFVQALQLLSFGLETGEDVARCRIEGQGVLHVRLARRPGGRIAMRCFDDGHCFGRLLPDMHLDAAVLRPLVTGVLRAGGSICLHRGRCVEFEIIGAGRGQGDGNGKREG